MPFFVKVRPYKQNNSGFCYRGYHVIKRGKVVKARWGAIYMPTRAFHWAKMPQERVYVFRTPDKAREKYEKIIHERERNEYDRLPRGQRIWSETPRPKGRGILAQL